MKPDRWRQQGFTLVELAVAFALLTVAILGTLSLAEYSKRINQGRAVGKNMLKLGAAVVEYKNLFANQLIAMPVACGQPTYGVGLALLEPVIGVYPAGGPNAGASLCSLVTKNNMQVDYLIANAMQPSLADLKAVGILEQGINESLVLATDTTRRVASAKHTLGQSAYGILIQRQCRSANCDPATGPFLLKSYVFNIQPYRVERGLFGSGARVAAALIAMEGKGFLSPIGGDGRLRNVLNQLHIDNPVQEANGLGAVGILAAYDGPGDGTGGGGLDDSKYTYRDGSRPPTNHWDFNNKDLTNVNALKSKSLDAQSGAIGKDNLIKQRSSGERYTDAAGPPSSDQLWLNKTSKAHIDANRGLLVRGNIVTTEQMGVYTHQLWTVEDVEVGGSIHARSNITAGASLSLGGNAAISGGLIVDGDASLMNVRMAALKTFGAECNTLRDSFARNNVKTDELLVCYEGVWSKMPATKPAAPPPPPPPPDKIFKLINAGGYSTDMLVDYSLTGYPPYTRLQSGVIKSGQTWQATVPANIQSVVVQLSGLVVGQGNWLTLMRDENALEGGCFKTVGSGRPIYGNNADMSINNC